MANHQKGSTACRLIVALMLATVLGPAATANHSAASNLAATGLHSSTHPDESRYYQASAAWFQWSQSISYAAIATMPENLAPTQSNWRSSGYWPYHVEQTNAAAGDYTFYLRTSSTTSSLPFHVNTLPPEILTVTPSDGEGSSNPFQPISAQYRSGFYKVALDLNQTQLVVDGVDVTDFWHGKAVCDPIHQEVHIDSERFDDTVESTHRDVEVFGKSFGQLYSLIRTKVSDFTQELVIDQDPPAGYENCSFALRQDGFDYQPPTPWQPGWHNVTLTITDTTVPPMSESKSWGFYILEQDQIGPAKPVLCDPTLNLDQSSCKQDTPRQRLPPNWLDSMEAILSSTPVAPGIDWDEDGIPDELDPVNLPSEATLQAASDDGISLSQGLELDGFALLVEPAHQEAYLLTATALAAPVRDATSDEALDWFDQHLGIAVRNAVASILRENMTVHWQSVVAETPLINQPFAWTTPPQADGSWLMVRTDPTRFLELKLGGTFAAVAAPLTSHPTGQAHELRWEIINVHGRDSFCYDAATLTGVSACQGNMAPGWIRAFSGQAAYTLEATELALFEGLLPLTASNPLLPFVAVPQPQPPAPPQPPTPDGFVARWVFETGTSDAVDDLRHVVMEYPNFSPIPYAIAKEDLDADDDGQWQVWVLDPFLRNPAGTYEPYSGAITVRLEADSMTIAQASCTTQLVDAMPTCIAWFPMDNLVSDDFVVHAAPSGGWGMTTFEAARNLAAYARTSFRDSEGTVRPYEATVEDTLEAAGPATAVPITDILYTNPADLDEDGYSNDSEAGSGGSNPAQRGSTPRTDDDGDGRENRDENHYWSSGNKFFLCTGSIGIVQDSDCHGYTTPAGLTLEKGPSVLGKYPAWPHVGRDSEGRIWVWDGICAPALQGRYADCKSTNNRGASSAPYGGDWISDGYGWRHVETPVVPTPEIPVPIPDREPSDYIETTGLPDAGLPDPLRTTQQRPPFALNSAFDAESPWKLLGNQSRSFDDGIGIDYLFDIPGLEQGEPLLRQVKSIDDPSPDSVRLFHFQGDYIRISANPDDLVHLELGIESLDSAEGQTFLLDGKALASLLPLNGHEVVVEIDEAHQAGFQQSRRDVDGDGYLDVLVWVPHFSQTWINIYSSQACSYVKFWDVKVVSSTSAWLSSSCGAVYEYKGTDGNGNSILQRYPITAGGQTVSTSQAAYGLHLMGSREFYVAGGSDCTTGSNRAFIAHFQNNAFDSVTWFNGCGALYDVWMNPSRTKGYTGGSNFGLMQYNGASWGPTTFATKLYGSCSILDIDLDANGIGYLGLAIEGSCRANDPAATPVMYIDGNTLQAQSSNDQPGIYDINGPGGQWATGIPTNGGPGIFRQAGSQWQQVYPSGGQPPSKPYLASATSPDDGATWFAGYDSSSQAPFLMRYDGSWSQASVEVGLPANSNVHRISVLDCSTGLAVGTGIILRLDGTCSPGPNSPPFIPYNGGYVSDLAPLSDTLVNVDGRGVFDPEGDQIQFSWSWGDGSYATSTYSNGLASHKYNTVGDHIVKLTASDELDSSSKVWIVSVQPQIISSSTTAQHSFAGSPLEAYHYRIDGAVGKALAIALQGCPNGHLVADNSGPVPLHGFASSSWGQIREPLRLVGAVTLGSLHVAIVRENGGAATCTLSVQEVPLPSTPTISSLPVKGVPNVAMELRATAPHPAGHRTSLLVNWGDGSSTTTPLDLAGTTRTTTHSFARGTYTVQVRTQDEFGQTSSASSQVIRIIDRPLSIVNSVGNPGDDDALLSGSVTDRGQATAAETKARYILYASGSTPDSPLQTSSWYTNIGSTVPSWTVTGLTAGAAYRYVLEVDNSAWVSRSAPSAVFRTDSTTTTKATFVSPPSSLAATVAGTLQFRPDLPETQNVRYHVAWGDGTSSTTGWFASGVTGSATHTYAFPHGALDVDVQIETASGSFGTSVSRSFQVTGNSPAQSVTSVPLFRSARLTGALNSNLPDTIGTVEARIKYTDPATGNVVAGPWSTVVDNAQTPAWTTPTLAVSPTYQASLEFKAYGGATQWTAPQTWAFRSNQAPTLTSLDGGARRITYLEDGVFRTEYRDVEGDAPGQVILNFNGQTYPMHSSGSVDYKAGVEYTYVLRAGDLQSGMPHYTAADQFQAASLAWSGWVQVTRSGVATHTFETDSAGGLPTGFTLSDDALNYWHITDTALDGYSGYAALGGHGKAAWFGHGPAGDYHDPGGGAPRGMMQSQWYDLSLVERPMLSFSSFYDTPDEDRKTVWIRTEESGWNRLRTIQGESGGYQKWRTQTIDLSAFARREVQVAFKFEAADNRGNNQLGWLVDDFSIGHDHDADTLPDDLERGRQDIRVSRQQGTILIGDGATSKAYVRRLDRPSSDAAILQALVSHPQPSDLRLSVGVQAGPGETAPTPVLLAVSSPPCAVGPWLPGQEPGGQAVTQMQDGLLVSVDLRTCGFSSEFWRSSHDWYLQVEDTQGGDGQRAIVEQLRITSWGSTDFMGKDTDDDGRADGVEVNSAFDALGVDGDADSLPEDIDPNEAIPSWAPALRLASTNYRDHVDVEFVDLTAPLIDVTILAHYPNDSNWWVLGKEPRGSGWRAYVDIQETNTNPDFLGIHWLDAYGNSGVIDVGMAASGSKYGPASLDWRAVDAATGQGPSVKEDLLPGLAQSGTIFIVGLVAEPTLISEGVAVARAIYVVGAFAAAGVLALAANQASQELVWDPNNVENDGTRIQYDPSKLAAAASSMGVSAEVLKGYLANAERIESRNGQTRWLYEPAAGVLVVLVTEGSKHVQHFKEGMKWQLPNAIDWTDSARIVEDFLLTEGKVQEILGAVYGNDAVGLLVSRLSRLALATCAVHAPFAIASTDSGSLRRLQDEMGIPLCVTTTLSKGLKIVDDVDDYAFRQDVVDTMIGELTFGHLKQRAETGNFRGEIYWYWDDDPSAVQAADCDDPSSWTHPDIRRCNDYDAQRPIDRVSLGEMTYRKNGCPMCLTVIPSPYGRTVTVPDLISVRELDWDTSGHKHFRDAFASNGRFVSLQDTARNGLDYRSWAIAAIEDQMPDLPEQNKDATVAVAYVYTEPVFDSTVDFRRFNP